MDAAFIIFFIIIPLFIDFHST